MKRWCNIILYLVFFFLGTNTILPLFDRYNPMIVSADGPGGDVDFWIPYTSPGMVGVGYRFNYSLVWRYIKSHTQLSLEARVAGFWYPTSGLSILYRNISDDNVKFTLQFNATQGIISADYRLTLLLDMPHVDFTFDNVNKTICIHQMAFGRSFNLSLNYSDIASIPGLVFSRGVQNGHFWFRIQRNNVPHGVYVLDPSYLVSSAVSHCAYSNGKKIVMSSTGVLFAAYLKQNTVYDVYLAHSHDFGVTWTEQRLTYYSAYAATPPAIAIDSNNLVHIVYENDSGYPVYSVMYRTYNHTTNVTSNEVNIRDSISYSIGVPSITVDGNNNVHVVYPQIRVSGKNKDIRYRKLTVSSGVWGAVVNLSIEGVTISKDQSLPCIISDKNNNLYVYWYGTHTARGTTQIRAKKYWASNSSWSVKVNNVTGTSVATSLDPSATVDLNGNVYLAWEDTANSIPNHYRIRFVNSTNGFNTWGTIKTVADIATGSGIQALQYPSVSCDNSSKVHLVFRNLTINYRNTSDGGQTWGSLLSLTSAADYYPCLLWSMFPLKSNLRPDVLKKGYCFVWTNLTTYTVNFYKSDDIIWNVSAGSVPINMFPVNGSIDVDLSVWCSFVVINPFGMTTTVTWQTNTTGPSTWITRQVNSSMASGSTVRYHYTLASSQYHQYWWRIWLNDSTFNTSFIYRFSTTGAPLITDMVPVNSSVDVVLSPLMNVTVTSLVGHKMTTKWITNYSSSFIFRPDGIGNHTGMTPDGDTPNWRCVDDISPDSATTRVYGFDKWDTYRMQNHTTQTFVIYNVTVRAYIMYPGGDFNSKLMIRTNNTYYNSTNFFGAYGWEPIEYSWTVNPFNGFPWTWTDIDNLEIGINFPSESGSCTQVYCMINPTPSGPVYTSGWYEFSSRNLTNNATCRQTGTVFNSYDTMYWWKVVVNDTSNTNTSDIFHFTTESQEKSWTTLFTAILTGGNITTYQSLFLSSLTGGNITHNNNLFSSSLTGGNTTRYNTLFSSLLTGGNQTISNLLFLSLLSGGNITTSYVDLFTASLTGGNTTAGCSSLFSSSLSGGNISSATQMFLSSLNGGNISNNFMNLFSSSLIGGNITTGYSNLFSSSLTGGNSSMYSLLFSGLLTGGNISSVNIIISNPVPSNGSTGVLVVGFNVNTSVQVNSSDFPLIIRFLSNSSGSWLVYNSSVLNVNGTVLANNSNFSVNCTFYWWMVSAVNVTGGMVNSSVYHFKTSCAGGFVPMMIAGRWSGPLLFSLCCFVLPFLFFFWRRRKKRIA